MNGFFFLKFEKPLECDMKDANCFSLLSDYAMNTSKRSEELDFTTGTQKRALMCKASQDALKVPLANPSSPSCVQKEKTGTYSPTHRGPRGLC